MFGFRKLKTTNRGTEELTTAVDLWVVEWTRRYGEYSNDKMPVYQAFASRTEAQRFYDSLVQAFALIGNTCENTVKLYQKKFGL